MLDHLPPNEEVYERHINQDTYDEGEFFQETHIAKKNVSRNALLHPRTLK